MIREGLRWLCTPTGQCICWDPTCPGFPRWVFGMFWVGGVLMAVAVAMFFLLIGLVAQEITRG